MCAQLFFHPPAPHTRARGASLHLEELDAGLVAREARAHLRSEEDEGDGDRDLRVPQVERQQRLVARAGDVEAEGGVEEERERCGVPEEEELRQLLVRQARVVREEEEREHRAAERAPRPERGRRLDGEVAERRVRAPEEGAVDVQRDAEEAVHRGRRPAEPVGRPLLVQARHLEPEDLVLRLLVDEERVARPCEEDSVHDQGRDPHHRDGGGHEERGVDEKRREDGEADEDQLRDHHRREAEPEGRDRLPEKHVAEHAEEPPERTGGASEDCSELRRIAWSF